MSEPEYCLHACDHVSEWVCRAENCEAEKLPIPQTTRVVPERVKVWRAERARKANADSRVIIVNRDGRN